MNNKLALLVSIILGVLSIVGIQLYIQKIRQEVVKDQEMVNAYVAVRDIEAGETIADQDVDKIDVPNSYLRRLGQTHIKDRKLIVGSRAQLGIAARQIIQNYHVFVQRSSGKTLALDAGYQAMTIQVDAISGIAGLLRPGDFVNVIGAFELDVKGTLPNGTPFPKQFAMTLLQKIKILAVDRVTDRNSSERRFRYKTVTLRLRPQQITRLAHATNFGKITLSQVKDSDAPDARTYPATANQIIELMARELK